MRAYWEDAFRVAFLLLADRGRAEDVAQEAIVAALKGLPSFETGRPFAPWLRRIAANRAHDVLRLSGRRPEVVLEEMEPAALDAIAAEIAPLALDGDLLAALRALDPRERQVVVLRHLLDYSPSEIAEQLDTPPATIRSRLFRALSRLREQLEHSGGEVRERAR